jgi:diaminopimelate epimerase
MITLPFTKMHGLGNDFMVVDATVNPFPLTREQIRSAADRHRGVGFDQLLVIAPPPRQREVDFTYLIYNGDGSSAQQCGNGARCVARFIHERGLSHKKELDLLTDNKITRVSLEADNSVTVEISEPYFEPAQIPFTVDGSGPPYHLTVDGKDLEFQVVGVGNPHAVILTKKIDAAVVAMLGGQLSRHPNFPEGVNVGFMQIETPAQIFLQVNERGAGPTLNCGSGACAAVAVGRRLGLLQGQVQVNQPGGELWVSWHGPGSPIRMRGPAQFVYEGSLFLAQS